MDLSPLASARRSSRKYNDQAVAMDVVVECIRTATTAPSGCNSQCWEFVVIHGREKINALADIVAERIRSEFASIGFKDDPQYIEGQVRGVTFFRKAPVCIAVFITDMEYYDGKMESAYAKIGVSHRDFLGMLGNPDLLSIGAAVQTLLLALQEKNLGACWMNEPLIAKKDIEAFLGDSARRSLVSLIPVGYSAYTPENKEYKAFSEVVKNID